MIDCEHRKTPLLDAQMALSELHLCGLVWEARTDFGTVGAGRRAILRKSDKVSQGSGHPQLDPTCSWSGVKGSKTYTFGGITPCTTLGGGSDPPQGHAAPSQGGVAREFRCTPPRGSDVRPLRVCDWRLPLPGQQE